jgi:hypothetical protein
VADDDVKKRDVVFVGPKSADGDGYRVVRQRDESLEVGELRSAKEGRPIVGELVRLTPREEHERLFDVDVVLPKTSAPALPEAGHKGPARVASEAYRTSWDRIFGASTDADDDLPN